MSKNKGLYKKFVVHRTDGTSTAGNKHEGCSYFVLDLNHDRHAMSALMSYAAVCETTRPKLAKDLRDAVDHMARLRRAGQPENFDLSAFME